MSSEPSHRDYRTTHNVLNHLRSQYQGWYAHGSVLAQLGHAAHDPDHTIAARRVLDRLGSWRANLRPGGDPLIWEDGHSDYPEAIAECDGMLTLLEGRLSVLGEEVRTALGTDDGGLLLAAYAWDVYAFDNLVAGEIAFAREFADEEILGLAEPHAAPAGQDVQTAGWLLSLLQHDTEQAAEVLQTLRSLAEPLPAGSVAEAHAKTAQIRHLVVR